MGKLGFSVIEIAKLKTLNAQAQAKGKLGVDPKALMVDFLAMKAADKVMFVRQCADHIGFTVSDPFEGKHADGDDGIPASMKRTA